MKLVNNQHQYKGSNMRVLRLLATFIFLFLTITLLAKPAWAFCGFYVSKADTKLYNKASQVVIARDQNRTVLTMANDYQGNVQDFALVVPVPVVLEKGQVNIGNPTIIERLDAFTAPRLVEYFDSNPCAIAYQENIGTRGGALMAPSASARDRSEERSLGVTIEARFTVGEYDILILSAKESDGLETWLNRNGYKMPKGVSQLLRPYIRQNMKFFVAKVNLKEFANTGFNSLRPLMMAYESPKFMLPIRLGMVNSQGEQDLIVYLLSPSGQTELTNYRTAKVPSDVEIPEFAQAQFSDFYKAMFKTAYEQEKKQVGFLEYAWDMANCDPCSAEPLNQNELKQAGVFWSTPDNPANVFISRLHVRYTRDKFPEDLNFQETSNRELFQGRYIIRHPFKGEMNCEAAKGYKQSVRERQDKEAQTLAKLTGWDINKIRTQIDFVKSESTPWWQRLWR